MSLPPAHNRILLPTKKRRDQDDASFFSHPSKVDLRRARDLVMRHGWNTMAYQILNPGIALWFPQYRDAVIGCVETRTHVIVAGSPVAPEEELDDVVLEFYKHVTSHNKKVCFFGAQDRIALILAKHAPVSSILLGAQPVWSPERFLAAMRTKQSLRAQVMRAKNKGVVAQAVDSDMRRNDDGSIVSELKRILAEWLSSRPLPPMHFLVEPNTLEDLEDRIVVVARIENEAVGFCIASPIPLRNGWLIEQIVRGYQAPNGTAELLLERMVSHLQSIGAELVTLGLLPLSQHYIPDRKKEMVVDGTAQKMTVVSSPDVFHQGEKSEVHHRFLASLGMTVKKEMVSDSAAHNDNTSTKIAAAGHPFWVTTLLQFTRLYGKYFYNFDGLDAFKSKFLPDEWEPVYAITNEKHPTPSTLYAVATAFSGMSPVKFVMKGLMKLLIKK
ncbi:MAG: DUF2156 domain-containing protein [Ignavibacteriales bacterium]|nr:DUF2156 domain-containing protein [Ignavibacteriales bacterium]